MLQFATEELAEGNLLTTKSLIDSILRNFVSDYKDTPERFKGQLKVLNSSVESLQQQIQDRVDEGRKGAPHS